MKLQQPRPFREPRPFLCRLSEVGLVLVMSLAAATLLQAQETSTIQGHIADASGADVPGALVRATNEATGVSRGTSSAADGYYRIVDLLPGKYEIRVELAAFKTVVKNGVELSARATTGLNFSLEVGDVNQTVTVSGEDPQVETQVARITEVLTEKEVRALPAQGRGILNLVYSTPGISGKPEGSDSGSFRRLWCCDAMSQTGAPDISSGGREAKANFTVDGISMRYTEGSFWGMAFSPNQDAVGEMRVSMNPDTAEFGITSGPQVRITTKGGTNNWHGTGHFTDNEDSFNAVPFRSTRDAISGTHTHQFGGTLGGPIFKNRLFVFGAYEGLRERSATSYVDLSETKAFRDLVVQTRPNSIAAKLLGDYPPIQYPTTGLVDVGGPGPNGQWTTTPDGIPDIGEVVVDKPNLRSGNQYNGRIDYQSASGKDRVYGSYWFTRVDWKKFLTRPAFDNVWYDVIQSQNAVYTHSFSPNILNEVRFGHFRVRQITQIASGDYNIPGIATDDGITMGNIGGWTKGRFVPNVNEINDLLSINRGRHQIKVGGGYRRATLSIQTFLSNEIPSYNFATITDFANDNPYNETRTLDVATGKTKIQPLFFTVPEMSYFVSNTWQLRPNLTLNYGLRYEVFFPIWMGNGRDNFQPGISSNQLNVASIASVTNQRVNQFYGTQWNNFSPRIGVAWDPSHRGKISIRGNFAILHDEINTFPFYDMFSNPPGVADVSAGVQQGIPIVYGLAPPHTFDFPVNPNLTVQGVNSVGGFDGVPVGIAGTVRDLKIPTVYDMFGGVQYQLTPNLMVFGDYKYRRTTNDIYAFDANRLVGDLLDGQLDRVNPNWNSVILYTNLGRRIYNGVILGASKRFSHGLQVGVNYTYSYSKNNRNYVGNFDESQVYTSQMTQAFNPQLDWARDDTPHIFHLHAVWELPILRGRQGWLAGAFGGWQLSPILNLQSGNPWIPVGSGGPSGDFNKDGQGSERPDRPTTSVPRSFSTGQWLSGTTGLRAALFPRPPASELRTGNLPRDYFRGPGYARADASLAKVFAVPMRADKKGEIQLRLEAFNAINRVNITDQVEPFHHPVLRMYSAPTACGSCKSR
jgi:hypothetical protein